MIDEVLYRLIGPYPDWLHLELYIQFNIPNSVIFEQPGLWKPLILRCLSMLGQPHRLCASLNHGPQIGKFGKYDFANGRFLSLPGLSRIQTSNVKTLFRCKCRLHSFCFLQASHSTILTRSTSRIHFLSSWFGIDFFSPFPSAIHV